MIVVTFLSGDSAKVSFEPSDLETLNKAVEASGLSREAFIRDAIDKAVSSALEAETPAEEKQD